MSKQISNILFVIVFVISLFVLSACGTDDATTDGDQDQAVDGDSDVEQETVVQNPFAGMWKLQDTSAFKWYAGLDIDAYYLYISGNNFVHFYEKDGKLTCQRQQMSLGSDDRYLPNSDSASCWYEFEHNDTGGLVMQSRHSNDPSDVDRAWFFNFVPETLPGSNDVDCETLDICLFYFVE